MRLDAVPPVRVDEFVARIVFDRRDGYAQFFSRLVGTTQYASWHRYRGHLGLGQPARGLIQLGGLYARSSACAHRTIHLISSNRLAIGRWAVSRPDVVGPAFRAITKRIPQSSSGCRGAPSSWIDSAACGLYSIVEYAHVAVRFSIPQADPSVSSRRLNPVTQRTIRVPPAAPVPASDRPPADHSRATGSMASTLEISTITMSQLSMSRSIRSAHFPAIAEGQVAPCSSYHPSAVAAATEIRTIGAVHRGLTSNSPMS